MTTQEFLELLFADVISESRKLSIFTLPNKRSVRFATVNDAAAYVATVPRNRDVYQCMSLISGDPKGRGDRDDTAAITCLWCDLDLKSVAHKSDKLPESIDDAVGFFKSLPIKPTLLVDSGWGVHGYWLIDQPLVFESETDRESGESYSKGWHQYICNEAVKRGWEIENLGDLPRVLRTPGTWNNKSEPRLVKVIVNSGEIHSLQAFDAYIKPKVCTPKVVKRQYNGTDVFNRCLRYLDKIPGAIEGKSGGKQTLIACRAIFRFGLDGEAARSAFDHYNTRCEPQWTKEKEIAHKLSDAKKIVERDGEFGKWATDGSEFAAYTGPDVDLRAIMDLINGNGNGSTAKPADIPSSPLTFPQECLRPPGLLSQVIEWNLRTALWPQPELALAGALALLGTITGRKVQDTSRTRTNVYCLGLAASGAGKEQARFVNKEILLRAGADKMLGPEGFASSAGMVAFINTQRSILFQLDEISRMLETMRDPRKAPHLFKIGSELMKLDSCSNTLYKGDAYANQKQSVIINQPHACIYGTAVPRGFWDALTEDNVSEGLLGRMFVFEAAQRYVGIATPDHCDPPAQLIDSVKWWLDMPHGPGDMSEDNPSPMVIHYSPAAQKRIDAHMAGICQQRATEDDTRAALWSRTTGKTAKLALLLACSRETGSATITIQREDVDRAIKISNWLTRRMIWQAYRHVSRNEREGASKKILRMLSTRMTKSELTRRTQWLDKRRRDEILSELIESGLVTLTDDDTGGRVKTTFLQAVP